MFSSALFPLRPKVGSLLARLRIRLAILVVFLLQLAHIFPCAGRRRSVIRPVVSEGSGLWCWRVRSRRRASRAWRNALLWNTSITLDPKSSPRGRLTKVFGRYDMDDRENTLFCSTGPTFRRCAAAPLCPFM